MTASHIVLAVVNYGRDSEIIPEPWRLGGKYRPEQVLCSHFTQFMLNNEASAAPLLPHNTLISSSLHIEAALPPRSGEILLMIATGQRSCLRPSSQHLHSVDSSFMILSTPSPDQHSRTGRIAPHSNPQDLTNCLCHDITCSYFTTSRMSLIRYSKTQETDTA